MGATSWVSQEERLKRKRKKKADRIDADQIEAEGLGISVDELRLRRAATDQPFCGTAAQRAAVHVPFARHLEAQQIKVPSVPTSALHDRLVDRRLGTQHDRRYR